MKHTTEDILINLDNLLQDDQFEMSILANASSWLYEKTANINWLGFYIYTNNNLYLGPFQGKVACNFIKMGHGVCGESAQKLKTVIVPDVSLFSGYIACDGDTKSEIVVPIVVNNQLYGVLDIDSPHLNRFTKDDETLFSQAAKIIAKHLSIVLYK
ncbi:MAG: GAF domain-containing protein [Bacilli bacterium]